jgi:hypothetical protein
LVVRFLEGEGAGYLSFFQSIYQNSHPALKDGDGFFFGRLEVGLL